MSRPLRSVAGRIGGVTAAALLAAQVGGAAQLGSVAESGELRRTVEQMKQSPRGPFESVRWFCRDGAVLPPKAGACSARGGGVQHGVLGPAARELRAQGFAVGQVLASLDPARFTGPDADLSTLRQLALERFLVTWDDGWIFRGARSYRGALQIEDEEAAAERMLLAMLSDRRWLDPTRFLLLREVARALPLPGRSDLAARVRALAAEIGDVDPGFQPLRARIHAWPSAGDADRVRAYARGRPARDPYEALASSIDALFSDAGVEHDLRELARAAGEPLAGELAAYAPDGMRSRLAAASRGLAATRRALPSLSGPKARLAALRASLLLEREAFVAAQGLLGPDGGSPSRREGLARIELLSEALFGAGLLGERARQALLGVSEDLAVRESIALGRWRGELAYLARATEWSRRWLRFHFGDEMERWTRLDPQAALFEADRLRGSPLLAYGAIVDELLRDAGQLAGVSHRVLGEPVGVGLRGLNPGIGRGRLVAASTEAEIEALPPDAVALLPETAAHLPPVAAILTQGEGSSVSHVQLLARNLGIPNAVVDETLVARLAAAEGDWLEVAVSPGGVVQVDALDGPPPAARQGADPDRVMRIDASRLELARTEPIDLDALGADASGRICGPKAANLGELRRRFPDLVPDGFAIPFGAFRRVLERPLEPGGVSAFEWLRDGYARIRRLEASERGPETAALLARARAWIEAQPLGPELEAALARELETLGGGVFVRSDTNVEDLPGFTGAGLNLTVPNVVGVDRVAAAVARVWASPFSDRAYAWRQAGMERPELVFPSVLVQLAFPADKSGVLITADVDSGERGVLSIATGEGVGGAVDGQAAEALRVDRRTGRVRLLAQATAPTAAFLDPGGGIARRPASGSEWLLSPEEIEALRGLADRVESHPALRGERGRPLPADVEFAFRDGQLALLQLRPFVDSPAARSSRRLRALDEPLRASASQRVLLGGSPGEARP